jgi:hypothetical protein
MYLVSKDYKTRKGAMSNIPIFIKRVNNPYYMKFSSIENARLGRKKKERVERGITNVSCQMCALFI